MLNDHERPGAVIAGGHFAALGAARSLSRHGVPVSVVDSEVCISQFSRHVAHFYRSPPETDEEGLVDFMIRLSSRLPTSESVLFATTDEQVRIFSQNRERLAAHYLVATPAWDVVRHLYDKRLSRTLAIQQRIPIPETLTLTCPEDVQAHHLSFPLVLKPAITPHLVSITKKKAYRANDSQELADIYSRLANVMDSEEILIQEFIPGGAQNLYSYFGYFRKGRPLAGYAARRLRQHPAEFGRATTFAVSICIPELEALATQLLVGIGYTGMAEVEFMFDPKHARFEFLEVNPRLWGWHTLANYAGVDLPFIAYADLTGQGVIVPEFIGGAKWMHLATDLPTSFLEIVAGRLTVSDYLQSIRGSCDAVLCGDDPIPFLAELLMIPYLANRRGF